MRKLFVAVLAIAGLVACNREETVLKQNGAPITFDSFVENATRANDPSTTTANIEEFFVWSYMNAPDGVVFDDEKVWKANGGWTYTETQYWLPGQNYYFAAIAGDRSNDQIVLAQELMDADGLGYATFTNVDGTNDFLYTTAERTTADVITAAPEAVSLQFDHLLSKVKFTFQNGFVNDNNTIVVKNIEMDVAKTAEVDLLKDDYNWEAHNGTTTLAFGDMEKGAKVKIGKSGSSDNERLTIPAGAEYEYTVRFTTELYNGAQMGATADKVVKIKGCELLPGRAYNFKATLNYTNIDENPLQEIEFVVEVDEWIEEDIEGGVIGDKVVYVNTLDELQAALNEEGALSIFIGADIQGNVTVYEQANRVVTINGNGKKFDGSFQIVGGSNYNNALTVFNNIKFETADNATLVGDSFIYCNEQNGNTRYPDSVTIKNCTFTATGAAENKAVGASFRSLKYDLIVEDCVATGVHSLMQVKSSGDANIVVDEVTINGKSGIGFGNATNVTLNNAEITAAGYGVRADGAANAYMTIENTNITASQPVIVRNLKTPNYNLNLVGGQLTPVDAAYHVVFTNGDDDLSKVTYAVPTGSFNLKGAEGYVVYPTNAAATVDEFKSALSNTEVNSVFLEADVDLASTSAPYVHIGHEVAISTNGHTLSVANASNYGLFCNAGSVVTFNDADIFAKGGAIVARDGAEVEFNSGSVKIESTATAHRHMIYAYGAGTTVTINDGEFSFDAYRKRTYAYVADGAVVYINGGVFGPAPNHPNDANAPFMVDGGQINITGGTFGFDPSAWVATGYKAVKNGSTWTVSAE